MINIHWTDGEMQAVTAAIEEGVAPPLDSNVAQTIRNATPPHHGATWTISLDFPDGQRLKAWCDARREREVEREPNETWTRIVARVNEAVQPFAPAHEPGARG